MAFFDDLQKKLTTTGQGAVQKTKNFAEITKLNQAIADMEKQNKEIFAKIGRTYFEKYASVNQDEEIAAYIGTLNQNIAAIEEKQNQIRGLKGLEVCPSCGAGISADAVFCPECGNKIIRQAPQPALTDTEQRKCAFCGAAMEEDAKFCVFCGERVKVEADNGEQTEI